MADEGFLAPLGVLGALCAFVGPLWNAVVFTYAGQVVPNELLGRVMSAAGTLTWGVMPLASRREDRNYQTYLARRPSAGAPWAVVEPVNQLWLEGSAMLGGFLTALRGGEGEARHEQRDQAEHREAAPAV